MSENKADAHNEFQSLLEYMETANVYNTDTPTFEYLKAYGENLEPEDQYQKIATIVEKSINERYYTDYTFDSYDAINSIEEYAKENAGLIQNKIMDGIENEPRWPSAAISDQYENKTITIENDLTQMAVYSQGFLMRVQNELMPDLDKNPNITEQNTREMEQIKNELSKRTNEVKDIMQKTETPTQKIKRESLQEYTSKLPYIVENNVRQVLYAAKENDAAKNFSIDAPYYAKPKQDIIDAPDPVSQYQCIEAMACTALSHETGDKYQFDLQNPNFKEFAKYLINQATERIEQGIEKMENMLEDVRDKMGLEVEYEKEERDEKYPKGVSPDDDMFYR